MPFNAGSSLSTVADEFIVNHAKAMSRRVRSLWFKKSDNDLGMNNPLPECDGTHFFAEKFLIDYVKMQSAKSIYGFSLNRKKLG